MKSFKMLLVSIACAFFVTTAVHAQESGTKKIGFLDLSKVFDQYERTKEFDGILEGKHKVYESERNKKIEAIKEAQGKLALLNEEEKAKVKKNIEQMQADLQEFDQAQRTDLTKQRDERLREILLKIEKVVSDFAKREKFDLILNDRVLIYGDNLLDITDRILAVLNEEVTKEKEKEKE